MQLVKIPAKCGSTAPLLLTHETVSAVNLLITHRHMAGVAAGNPFLFANGNSASGEPLCGHDCIRKAAVAAQVK